MSPDDARPDGAEPGDGTDESVADLRRELEAEKERIAALEAENARLLAARAMQAGGQPAPPRGRKRHHFWIAVLLVVATLLTPLSILAIFLKQQITDTGRYVGTVAPLARNAAIRAYVADEVSQQLFEQVDIKEYVEDALPRRADVLAGPLTSALQGFVRQAVERVLETEQFQTLWDEANRVAHAQVENVLAGADGPLTANDDGEVTVDLSQVTNLVQQQLQDTGIDVFANLPVGDIGGKITIFQSQDLYRVRTALRILNTVAFVLPFVIVACFAGAIYLSRDRRKGFVGTAIAFAAGAAILAVLLFVGRGAYLDAATGNAFPYSAASAVYDTLLRSLHTSVRAALFFSTIVVIAVFFAGPSRFAVWCRIRARQGANWVGAQADDAGWHWLEPNGLVVHRKRGMRVGVAVVAFVVLFRWSHPTPMVILGIALLTLAVLAVIELYGREPIPAEELAKLRLRRERIAAEASGSLGSGPAKPAPVPPS